MAEPRSSPPNSQRRLSEAELRSFLDAAAHEPSADLIRFLALTGLRLDEALGLSWPDVNLADATATIRRPTRLRRKGLPTLCLAFRTIDLPEPATALLGRRRELGPESGLVFREPGCDAPPSKRSVTQAFRATSMRAGVPDVNPWVLRRTWAGLLLDAGVPASYVSRSLGHASTAVTAAAQRATRTGKASETALLTREGSAPEAAAAQVLAGGLLAAEPDEPGGASERAHAWAPAHAMMAASARSSTG